MVVVASSRTRLKKLQPEGQQEDVPRRYPLDPVAAGPRRPHRRRRIVRPRIPKTKLAAAKLKSLGLDSVLIITDNVDENVYLATRNLPHVAVVEPRYADPLSLVHYKKVLITKPAIAQLEEMLG